MTALDRKISILILTCLVPAGCAGIDNSPIKMRNMPDLYYAYSENSGAEGIENSIAACLSLYANDPALFGDPVGIIESFRDSTGLQPEGRTFGLILTDPDWSSGDSLLLKKIIPGGKALAFTFDGRYDRLDSCWSEIGTFAENNGITLIPPGIEVYRGQLADTMAASTQMIIRIK